MSCAQGIFCKHERAKHRALTELEGETLVEHYANESIAREHATRVANMLRNMAQQGQPTQPPPTETAH